MLRTCSYIGEHPYPRAPASHHAVQQTTTGENRMHHMGKRIVCLCFGLSGQPPLPLHCLKSVPALPVLGFQAPPALVLSLCCLCTALYCLVLPLCWYAVWAPTMHAPAACCVTPPCLACTHILLYMSHPMHCSLLWGVTGCGQQTPSPTWCPSTAQW